MVHERRAAAREVLALPILLGDGSSALTRDISPEGLYFRLPMGASCETQMSLDYAMPALGLRFRAEAEVVRTESAIGGTGVAVRLRAQRLLPLS
jgi:hypothetical protein